MKMYTHRRCKHLKHRIVTTISWLLKLKICFTFIWMYTDGIIQFAFVLHSRPWYSSWWRFGLFRSLKQLMEIWFVPGMGYSEWPCCEQPMNPCLLMHMCTYSPTEVGFLGHRGCWPLEDTENFQSGWTNAHSHQEGKMVPTAPHKACSVLLSWAFPVRVTWWLSAVWICIFPVIQALNTFS